MRADSARSLVKVEIAPPLVDPPATTHVGDGVHATASGPGTAVASGAQDSPPLTLCSSSVAPELSRAVATHSRFTEHPTDVSTWRPPGRAAPTHRTPPSVDLAADAPFGPVPTAAHTAEVAHERAVPSASARGSVESWRHDWPLSEVLKTAVSVVVVTSAMHVPGPVQSSAATPDPGGCVAVSAETLLEGLMISTTAPVGPVPPSRQPDDQHDPAAIVVPVIGGTATGAHPVRPPIETSIAAAAVVAVGFVPPAMHQPPSSHATTDSVTVKLIAGEPVPSGGGAVAVVPHAASSDPAPSAMAPATSRVLTGDDGRRDSDRGGLPSEAMSWIDAVIVLWVVLAAVRGRSLGALAQLLGLLGFVVGLAIGSVIAVPVAGRLQAGVIRSVVTVGIVIGCAVLFAVGGNVLGKWANVAMRRHHLGSVDAVGGAAVAALGALLSAWLVAGLFTQSSVTWLAGPIQRSAVLTTLDAVMPPVPAVVARAQAFLSTEGFPAAFAALTQPTTTAVRLPSQRATALLGAVSSPSVLKVVASGGCGENREGTAFVVAPGLVVTNAHVVAGEPVVEVTTARGAVISTLLVFDPSLDVAILRVPHLTLRPIRLHTATVARGTPVAVVGYPGGGPRVATPGGIAGALRAQGRDIYGGGLVDRAIYTVSASVRPGNSGSPLVVGGSALGMVFSRSLDQSGLAYAIRASALVSDVSRATDAQRRASPGACTPG